MQASVAVRNARLDAIETAVGTSPILEIRSGAAPASCAVASTGTLLASLQLPSDWAAAASGGTKSKLGTWEDLIANNSGTAAHYRLFDSTNTTCHLQGPVSMAAGGGELILDNTNIAAGQAVTVTSWTFTEGGA